MKRYYFLFYDNSPRKLEYLINLIENRYNLNYSETRDFSSRIGLSFWISINFNNVKQIIFDKEGKNMGHLCKECYFPAKITWEKRKVKNPDYLYCINCPVIVIDKKNGKYCYINTIKKN